jgi:hypothetical protein
MNEIITDHMMKNIIKTFTKECPQCIHYHTNGFDSPCGECIQSILNLDVFYLKGFEKKQ